MEHTPTPWGIWHYEEGLLNGVNYIAGPNGENISTTICMDLERQKADALHIVRCVNSHDALVEALEECINQLKTLRAEAKERWSNERVNMVSAATVNGCYALKQANG